MDTVNIKGTEYVMVVERVKEFRSNEKYSGLCISTKLLHITEDYCVFHAAITKEDGTIVSSGHACENKADGFINKQSYIENCETSAVGRALGNLGIGIDTAIRSADEMANAVANADKDLNAFNRPKFTMTNFRKMSSVIKSGERDKTYEETLEYIRENYTLEEDMLSTLEEYKKEYFS